MILKKVSIHNFRCIDDSTEFSFDDVTCLVGKNESGKTAVLKALYRLKPDNDKEIFKLSIDYPKRKWKPNLPVHTEPVIITTWLLGDNDIKEINREFGINILLNNELQISKGYDNIRKYIISFDEQKYVQKLIADFKISFEDNSTVKTTDHLLKYLSGVTTKTQNQIDLLTLLNTKLAEGLNKALSKFIDNLLPTFLYFDQYTRLPGNISINEFNDKKSRNLLSENDKIFIALMSLYSGPKKLDNIRSMMSI